MPGPGTTCWTVIEGAGAGREEELEVFARVYLPVVRRYLTARWGRSSLREEVDDAVQAVFLDCLHEGGPLSRADRNSVANFRGFLYGVTRNVALMWERRRASGCQHVELEALDPGVPSSDDSSPERVFDRAWTRSIVREALRLQIERAGPSPDGAERRVELLRLRAYDGLPIREIARRWNEDPDRLHRWYATARREFRSALREVLAIHGGPAVGAAERSLAELVGGTAD